MIRPSAEFQADFPDDQIEDEFDIIRFSGRGVAEAIVSMLRGLGYDTSTPEHQQENGWGFEVKSKPERVWMQISDQGDVFVLSTEYNSGRFFSEKGPLHAEVLTRLNGELAKDPRFRNVKWQALKDVLSEAPGAKTPVDD